MDQDNSIPRSPQWYAREPFDPTVVAFRDNEGKEHRYMHTPLDEIYAAEPRGAAVVGSLPPEEREVRDTLLVTTLFRSRVSWLDILWSQLVRPTKAYQVSLDHFDKLDALCARSREYRAAFCRLSTSNTLAPGLRRELKRIVQISDQRRSANRVIA